MNASNAGRMEMDRNFVAAQRMPREIEEPSAASSLFYALFIVCGRRCPLSMRINAGVGHPGEGRFGKWEAWSAFPGNVLSYTTTTCFRKGRRERRLAQESEPSKSDGGRLASQAARRPLPRNDQNETRR